MKTYPEVITADVLAKNAHLNDVEVLSDLRATEAEIRAYDLLADGLDASASLNGTPEGDRRMHRFRASGYREANRNRRAFCAFLERLLDARAAAAMTTTPEAAAGDPTGRTVGA
jgi:hypothetical protein